MHKDELKGDTIKLIFRDTKNPGGAVAKSVVQELITRDKVDIIGGIVFSPNAMSIAGLATQAKVPVVIMNAGTSFITNMSPNLARVSFTMWQAGFIMGEHAAKNLNCKTAVAGFTNYPPGKDSVAAFKRGLEGAGGKLVDAIPMGGPGKVPDFTPFLQRAKDKKPNCFYVFVPGGNHASAVVRAYKQLGMKEAGVALIGPGDITHDTLLQGMGDAAVGLVTASHYYADLDNPANKAFVAAWKKAYGADTTPDFVGVGGYDGMAAIYHVIKSVKGKITAEKAMAALKGWTFDSPRGKIMIDPETRDIVQNVYIMEVGKDGNRLVQNQKGVFNAVKDKCKELKIGRCGK
ncbi:MAG: ABC transporter substrate-binding protein [Bauldia litoralis]